MQTDIFQENQHVCKPAKLQQIRIPYMGSKRAIAEVLIDEMLKIKPKAKYFYDLFGGGGAMSFTALQYGLKVYYNELQTSLVEFLQYTLNRIKTGQKSKFGSFPEEWYKFVSREEFNAQKHSQTPYAQFVRICCSFGNGQKNYLFNRELEIIKHLAHNVVIFQCENARQELSDILQIALPMPSSKTWNERRLEFQGFISKSISNHSTVISMIESKFVKDASYISSNSITKYLQQKHSGDERLQQLERLKRLEQLQPFTISNLSFDKVLITTTPDETIIYCDPPYRNTTKYIEGKDFDYNAFDNWFANHKYTCFLSEYNAPHKSIFEINKAKMMNNKGIDKRSLAIEKLFWNGVV